jgi:serine/threonine protein kinase
MPGPQFPPLSPFSPSAPRRLPFPISSYSVNHDPTLFESPASLDSITLFELNSRRSVKMDQDMTQDVFAAYEHGHRRRADYKTLRYLGAGSQGSVKEAQCLRTGRRVAIKSVHKKPSSGGRHTFPRVGKQRNEGEESLESAFARKCDIFASLQHSNLVEVIEHFETASKHYLVMEHCEGDLLELLDSAGVTLSERDIRVVLRGVLEALAYLHSHGITHR